MAQPPLFAVADGMGGAQAGEVASGMAVSALREAGAAGGDELAALAQEINSSILSEARGDAGRSGMGTTLTAAVIVGDHVDFIHAGDSRAYRLRAGKLEQLSADHSLVAEMVRRGDLSEEEAIRHPQRSIITRALGVEADLELDRFSADLEPGDLFLLCSDGLYSMVPAADIEAVLSGSADLTAAAEALVEAANAGGGEDNVTVVLFSPDGSVPSGDPVPPEAGSSALSDTAPRQKASGRSGWWRSWKMLAVVTAVLVILLASGTWYMTRQIYYLGVNDGQVSIFQGLPMEVGPVSLSSLYRQSDIPLDELEPFEQDRVLRQELSSLEEAEQVLENYSGQHREDSLGGPPDTRRGTTGATTSTGVRF